MKQKSTGTTTVVDSNLDSSSRFIDCLTKPSPWRTRKFSKMKQWRLIIRNLPFKCTVEELRNMFEPFGPLDELIIKQKPNGMSAGFGFVQFLRSVDADTALKSLNLKEIKGRAITLNYTIPKDEYMTKQHEEKEAKKQLADNNQSTTTTSDDDEESTTVAEEVDESVPIADSKMEKGSKVKETFVKPPRASDVDQGKTLFIRNLSFSVDQSKLKTFFEQFGSVEYAVICKHRGTEHSKGSGFVKFLEKADAESCLRAYENNGSGGDVDFVLDDRLIALAPAIERQDAKTIEEKKVTKDDDGDKRNLHLLRVSLIRPGSQDDNGISTLDVQKRQRIEKANRVKIKNLHIFVSPTRLVVHNIPRRVADDVELKKICLSAIGRNPFVVVKECRIMRDMKQLDLEGRGRSLGYAFVEFTLHEHALKCLKGLNNNPDVFSDAKRPIVEFSLENRKALAAKAKRREMSQNNRQSQQQQQRAGAVKVKVPMAPNASGHKVVQTIKGKIKAYPSHSGPKIRHRDRKRKSEQRDGKKQKQKKQKLDK